MQLSSPFLFHRFSRSPAATPTSTSTAVWCLAVWLASVGNLPLWQRIVAQGGSPAQRAALILGMGALIAGATAALLSLLAWPRMFRPLASVLLLVSAFNTHFMWQYGTVIDPTMLANVLHTDTREVRDLLSWSMPGTVLMVAGLPLWALWRRPLLVRPAWPQALHNVGGALAAFALLVLAAMLSYQGMASLMRNHKDLRFMANPLNTVYAGFRLAVDQLPRQVHRLQPVGEDAALGASYEQQVRPPLLVLVIGETARAQNFGLNGYVPNTTPALARWQERDDLVNFSDVSSCGTNTQVSLPCIFSPLTRTQGGNKPAEHENLLDVLQRAGLGVLWIDNQSGCKGVCDRVPNLVARDQPVPKLCRDGECLDAAMLDGLDQRIAGLDPQRRARGVVIVLHQMGSHGPAYSHRAPDDRKPFMPECTSVTLSDCPHQQLVNAYDNSISYTDHFLDQTLQWLKARSDRGSEDTGLIYVSDHGESLGENGLYLHGIPYALAPEQQTHVPMVAWFSRGLQQRNGLSINCLRERAAQPVSHDNFFHTILGVMDVQTRVHQLALDTLAPCSMASQSRLLGTNPAKSS